MRERQRLLADNVRDDAWLSALEREMASHGCAIAAARVETVAQLQAAIDARPEGAFPKSLLLLEGEIEAQFAAMAFYGAIEQMLTGWIFGLLPQGEEHFERAKWLVVEAVCGGLETRAADQARVG